MSAISQLLLFLVQWLILRKALQALMPRRFLCLNLEDGLYEEPILLTSHVDHVENQVTQKMQQTINLLEDMTGKYTAHGEILKQLQEANREFQLRLGTLEKNGGGAGSTTAGSTVGQPSDGGRQPALVTGGWNPDQDARETRQAAEDILRSVEAPIDLEGMFVPGFSPRLRDPADQRTAGGEHRSPQGPSARCHLSSPGPRMFSTLFAERPPTFQVSVSKVY